MSSIFGETLTFTQQNGDPIRLVTFGDERYGRFETQDGFTVLYDDEAGAFCYAERDDDAALRSTGRRLDRPPPRGLPRHVRDSGARRQAWIRARTERMLPPPEPGRPPADPGAMLTLGPDSGLLRGRKLDSGLVGGLTILVRFPDLDTAVTPGDVDNLLNARDYTGHGNACSVNDYFRRMSTERLDYRNTVVGPFTLSRPRLSYASETRRGLLVPEAIQLALDSGVTLADFDSLGEGIVDALSIVYAGPTEYRGDLWPHNWVHEVHQGRTKTQLYTVTSMGSRVEELSIGTFCHEAGHMLLRWPDTYDYGTAQREGDDIDSAGMGRFCLMGSGNHLDRGKTPAAVSAYLRDLSGWCTAVELKPGQAYQADHGRYDTVLRHSTTEDNEYFLVENRTRLGLDAHLPDSGLAVYHCDTRGSNEFQQGAPTQHYQCALLQADGHLDLETNRNTGDQGDLFTDVSGIALSHATLPHSRTWAGSDSGLTIRAVDGSGRSITFRIGSADVVDADGEDEGGVERPAADPVAAPVGGDGAVPARFTQ